MLKEVTKDMLIGEILQADATVAPILIHSTNNYTSVLALPDLVSDSCFLHP